MSCEREALRAWPQLLAGSRREGPVGTCTWCRTQYHNAALGVMQPDAARPCDAAYRYWVGAAEDWCCGLVWRLWGVGVMATQGLLLLSADGGAEHQGRPLPWVTRATSV